MYFRGIEVKNSGRLGQYSRLYSYSNAYTVCGASSSGRATLILLWGVRGVRMCVGTFVLNCAINIWELLGRKQTTNSDSSLGLFLCSKIYVERYNETTYKLGGTERYYY